jgi:hypothetical protein
MPGCTLHQFVAYLKELPDWPKSNIDSATLLANSHLALQP